METDSKLKPVNPKEYVYGLLGGLLTAIVFVLIWIFFGETLVDKTAGTLFALFAYICLVIWIRTKNAGFFILLLLEGIMAVRNIFSFEEQTVVTIYRLLLGILIFLFFYMLFKKKLKWYYRPILELAAKPVKESADGFTARPFPAGEASYKMDEIKEFGRFLSKNLIALPYMKGNRVIFVISKKNPLDFLNLRKYYQKDTYVSFDSNGKIEVNIARKEYDLYKKELTFDQLCASLGNLFIDFLKHYQEGNEIKIKAMINK